MNANLVWRFLSQPCWRTGEGSRIPMWQIHLCHDWVNLGMTWFWANYSDLTSRPNPEIMVFRGESSPFMAQHFKLVKYYNLPRWLYNCWYIVGIETIIVGIETIRWLDPCSRTYISHASTFKVVGTIWTRKRLNLKVVSKHVTQ